jgi:histidinol dehydrogenase
MSALNVKRLSTEDEDFWPQLDKLLAWESVSDEKVAGAVKDILSNVRSRGDAAVVEYTNRFDRMTAESMAELEIPQARMKEALERIPAAEREALEFSTQRLFTYHEHQRAESWSYTEADGTMLGQKVTPLDRVGLYVPGGKASYPSSVLMNAVPAKVAGVNEIIMVVPTPDGQVNDMVLAAPLLSAAPTRWRPWPMVPRRCPRWTRSSARAISMWLLPRVWCSVPWVSI